MATSHISDLQWHHAVGFARQACARVFRDGGKPEDALTAFGLRIADARVIDWARAVDHIAEHLCAAQMRRAA